MSESPEHDNANGTVTGTIARTPNQAVEAFKKKVMNRAILEREYIAERMQEAQLGDMFAAGTEEEMFAALQLGGMTALKDLDNGTEIEITGFHYVEGTDDEYKNSLGVFVVIDAVRLSDGGDLLLDTGVERVIAYLDAIETGRFGYSFPVRVRVAKTRTRKGRDMVSFEKIPERVSKGETA